MKSLKIIQLFKYLFRIIFVFDVIGIKTIKAFEKSHNRSRSNSSYVYKSYQTSIYCSPSTEIKIPDNVSELQEILLTAIKNKQTVKALGSLHSISDIICTDGIPISMSKINYTIENDDGTATFGAGIEVQDAMLFLEARNKTLIHVPAYGGITIGGALGTGAHGSSLLHPTSISDQVLRLTILDGTGKTQIISLTDDLNAFRVHLGLLGIILDVTVKTVPLFKMTVENKVEPESILLDGTALSWAKQYDWYEMWWFPSLGEVVVSKGVYKTHLSVPVYGNSQTNLIPNETPLVLTGGKKAYETLQTLRSTTGLYALEKFTELSLYTSVIGKPAIFSKDDEKTLENPATGYSWRLQSNKCNNKCAWDNGINSILPEESSMAFNLTELPAVIKTIKNILSQTPASFSMIGIFIRFSQASDSLMAISYGRPTFTVEWTTPMRNDRYSTSKDGIGAYQAILQAMVRNHEGRPHWGKNGLYYFTQEILKTTTPNRQAFIGVMNKFDPEGIFLNKFGRRILGLSDLVDIDPNVKHCALQDYCICSKATDCASLQSCSNVSGFQVCRDLIEINLKPLSAHISSKLTSIFSSITALSN